MNTITYFNQDEYLKLLERIDHMRLEFTQLQNQLRQKNEELSFIKENKEGILVITQDSNGNKCETKRKEKDVISEVVQINQFLHQKLEDSHHENQDLQNQTNQLQNQLAGAQQKIQDLEETLKALQQRSLWQRIINH